MCSQLRRLYLVGDIDHQYAEGLGYGIAEAVESGHLHRLEELDMSSFPWVELVERQRLPGRDKEGHALSCQTQHVPL